MSLPTFDNLKTLENDVGYYIDHTLTQTHPEFANLPKCPYVQKYREHIKVAVALNTPYEVLGWALRNWTEQDIAWVYAWHPQMMPKGEMAERIIEGFDSQFNKIGATIFLDHPDFEDQVGGVYTGFGKGMLIVIQNTDILRTMRTQLLKTDYYSNWSDEDARSLCD